jgi:hypothetical protein
LFDGLESRRLYYQDEYFLVFENLNTSSPFLVARDHNANVIPIQAFVVLKQIASKLYGERFSFVPSSIQTAHYHIKVVRLATEQVSVASAE